MPFGLGALFNQEANMAEFGGIVIISLLMGLVEFLKAAELIKSKREIMLTTVVIGFLLFAAWKSLGALETPPETPLQIARLVFEVLLWSIAGPLSAMGWYDLQRAFRPQNGQPQ
jgi:uncharacterized membrane protein YkvI